MLAKGKSIKKVNIDFERGIRVGGQSDSSVPVKRGGFLLVRRATPDVCPVTFSWSFAKVSPEPSIPDLHSTQQRLNCFSVYTFEAVLLKVSRSYTPLSSSKMLIVGDAIMSQSGASREEWQESLQAEVLHTFPSALQRNYFTHLSCHSGTFF